MGVPDTRAEKKPASSGLKKEKHSQVHEEKTMRTRMEVKRRNRKGEGNRGPRPPNGTASEEWLGEGGVLGETHMLHCEDLFVLHLYLILFLSLCKPQ